MGERYQRHFCCLVSDPQCIILQVDENDQRLSILRDHIHFIFRGKRVELQGFSPVCSVLNWLREDQRATGTKEGCNEGDCGACTAVVVRQENGKLVHRPVNTCITFVGMLDGAELLTVEDLSQGNSLHAIQQAMVDHHSSQCGFCTPGIVMSLFAMGKEQKPVDRATINDQLAGNLCRCTGYRPIVDAAIASLTNAPADHFDVIADERLESLIKLENLPGAMVSSADGFFAVPRTLEELLALRAAHPDATILAGATDIGLWISKQFRPITKLIWLGRISALQAITLTDGALILGAGVTHAAAIPHLASISPDLGELGRRFGSTQVRAQGTIGGNIANGSPIGDWAPAFIALGAELTLEKQSAKRVLPLQEFFLSYGKQDREQTEIVTSVSIPTLLQNEHFRCLKISKRFDEDISTLMAAFKMTVEAGIVTRACIAFGGMAATPRRAPQTEAALIGVSLSDERTWVQAIAALAADYQPIDDMRASANYRRQTASVLLKKALIEMAGGTHTRIHQPRAAHSQAVPSKAGEATHAH
jgi:xanthine dehydrogenase small subunit